MKLCMRGDLLWLRSGFGWRIGCRVLMGSNLKVVRTIGEEGYVVALKGENVFLLSMTAALADKTIDGAAGQVAGEYHIFRIHGFHGSFADFIGSAPMVRKLEHVHVAAQFFIRFADVIAGHIIAGKRIRRRPYCTTKLRESEFVLPLRPPLAGPTQVNTRSPKVYTSPCCIWE